MGKYELKKSLQQGRKLNNCFCNVWNCGNTHQLNFLKSFSLSLGQNITFKEDYLIYSIKRCQSGTFDYSLSYRVAYNSNKCFITNDHIPNYIYFPKGQNNNLLFPPLGSTRMIHFFLFSSKLSLNTTQSKFTPIQGSLKLL